MPRKDSLRRLEDEIETAIRSAKDLQLDLCAHILAMAKLELLNARLQKHVAKTSEKKAASGV